jgi:uncharacterized protein (TIGR00725 family)
MNYDFSAQIGVVGDSKIRSKKQYEICYELGKEITHVNAILICGGRGGVMEAVSKGVYDSGGFSIGILPTDEKDPEVNKYITVKIPTYLHWTRNSLIPLASDGVIACGGGPGTLSEISYTCMYGKPLVCITTISGWSREIGNRGTIELNNKMTFPQIETATNGKEAVGKILSMISRSK